MIIAAFTLLMIHGIGHLLGVVVSFSRKQSENWNTDSWLFNNWTSLSTRRSISSWVFLLPALASIVAALSLKGWMYEVSEWREVALIAAISSLIAIGIFPKALYSVFNRTAAILLNIGIIALMYMQPWTSIVL